MSNAQDIEEIEMTIEAAKISIERKNALGRLQNNPDFKSLIEEGFLLKHAVRQVLLKAHPGMQTEAYQNLLDQQITAVGGFKQFLISVHTEGLNSEQALAADEETREALLREDLANG